MEVMMKELGEIITGNTPSKKTEAFWSSEDICFIKPDIIADDGINEIVDSNEYISEDARKKARVVGKNSIFITCIGSIGKIGIASDGEYAFNQQINAIMPNDRVQPKYLAYNLLFNKPRLVAIANAPVVPIINKSQFGEFTVNIETDIDRQCEIVDVLDKLTQIIQQRNKEISALDELIKARFVEMFGDPVTNSLSWEEHRLEEYIEFLTSGSRGWSKYFVNEKNELFITIKNVKNNHIVLDNIQYIDAPQNKEAERTKVKTGDLLISITADLGRTAVVDKEVAEKGAYINQHLSLVRLDAERINPLFVSHFLETEGGKLQFKSKNQSAVKAGLNFEAIKSLKVLAPPIELQNQFADFVRAVDKSKVAVQKALDETKLLFDSLMQQYFG